jgi:hypothetical protein
MATFMAEPEKLQMNWPSASGSKIVDTKAAAIATPAGAAWRGGVLGGIELAEAGVLLPSDVSIVDFSLLRWPWALVR